MAIRDLSDIEALERTPVESLDLPASTYDMLARAEQQHAGRTALSFFPNIEQLHSPFRWTYRELLAEIRRVANALHALDLSEEDVVAYVLPNLPETHFVLWGAEANGIAFAVNPQLDGGAMAQLLEAGGARAVVTLAPTPGVDLWDKVATASSQVSTLKHVITVSLGRYLGGARGLLLTLLAQKSRLARLRNADGDTVTIHKLSTLMARQPGDRLLSGRDIRPEAVSSYFCTGGTTGLPKIAVREHGNEVFDAYAMSQVMPEGMQAGKTLFCGLPLFHVNAQLVTGLAPWAHGAQVVLATPQGYRGEGVIPRFWEIVEHYRVNFFSGVPTVYSALLQQPVGNRDISSLELGMCGAAPMPVELFRKFQQATGVRILEGYGLTEGTCASSTNPPGGEPRIGSIGLRLPWQAMRVLALDDAGNYQRDCETDEIGVIAIAGPNVFRGYLQEQHNKSVWIDRGDGRRWLNTGDMGRQDADGFFWLTGRKKELIIRGGHNIDPATIEEAFYRHPQVEMAAAVGRPDTYAGELPVAYVKLRDGETVSVEALRDYATREIAEAAAVPKHIRLVDELPLTAVGKIFKPALVMREIEDVVRDVAHAAGTALESLEVRQDPTRGVVAHLLVSDECETLREKLGSFSFAVEIDGGEKA